MATNLATTKMIQNIINGTTVPQQAVKATQDGSGNNIENTYAKQNGSYANMTVGNATNADNAVNATKATQDGAGNNIANTYATKEELNSGLDGKQPAGEYATATGSYPDMTVGHATSAATATNATNDGAGNNIENTYPVSLSLTIDSSTYVITAQLKNASGQNVGTAQTIDLPLESVVTSGSYDEATQSIILTLQNGSTISIPVSDLVDGLATQQSVDDIVSGTTTVGNATNAQQLAGVSADQYAKTDGTYPEMDVGSATSAGTAGQVVNSLTVIVDGVRTVYNGSSAQTINIATDGSSVTVIPISIPVSKWSSRAAVLTASDYDGIADVTATSEVQLIAADNSAAIFINNEINLTAQGAASITISCATTPTSSVQGTIMVYN